MKLMRRWSGSASVAACGVLLAGWLWSGCATTDEPGFMSRPPETAGKATPTPPVQGETDRFAIGELVIVSFSGTSEPIPPHEERIKEDGNITLPLIGAVKAVGKSPGELQAEIQRLYVPKYYVRLTPTVRSQVRVYYVDGEVRSPGPKEYIGETTVTKAIAAAGGFTDYAKKTAVELTRSGSSKPIKVNCKRAQKNPELDLPVFPGDKIYVPRTIW